MSANRWTPRRVHLLFGPTLFLLSALVFGAPVLGQTAPATAPFDAQAVYAQAAPAVVVVRGRQEGRGVLGSGFAIDPEGWILTAGHVARTATDLRVEFPNEVVLPARLAGYDARRDLALLQVMPSRPIHAVSLARDGVVPGEPVAVIGAPRGRPGVLTTGQVAGVNASLPGLVPQILIRVTAEVAPGSSGGPVLNGRGEVIGLVVASDRENNALAISGPTIGTILPALRAGARMERAWIGIAGRTLTPALAREVGASVDRGALIMETVPDSPAARAGLRAGDVIVAFEGVPVEEWGELLYGVGIREPGRTIRLVVVRGAERLTVEVTLGVRP